MVEDPAWKCVISSRLGLGTAIPSRGMGLYFLKDPFFKSSFLSCDIAVVSREVKLPFFQKCLISGLIWIVPLAQDASKNELQTQQVNGFTHRSCLVS